MCLLCANFHPLVRNYWIRNPKGIHSNLYWDFAFEIVPVICFMLYNFHLLNLINDFTFLDWVFLPKISLYVYYVLISPFWKFLYKHPTGIILQFWYFVFDIYFMFHNFQSFKISVFHQAWLSLIDLTISDILLWHDTYPLSLLSIHKILILFFNFPCNIVFIVCLLLINILVWYYNFIF